jgi:hypothetical protein
MERTICCILENYQREDGVEVPEMLRPYMCGVDFFPFKKKPAPEVKQIKGTRLNQLADFCFHYL